MQDCNNNNVVEFKPRRTLNGEQEFKITKQDLINEINRLPDGGITNYAVIVCVDGIVYRGHRTNSFFTLLGEIEDFKLDMVDWYNANGGGLI